jgi:nucleotide-binding universal stress UspA family protein
MVDQESKVEYTRALQDFHQARSKARMQRLWAEITGQSLDLLPFDEVTRKMHAKGLSSKGLQEVPVEAIVGSVNRYQDFNRNFLPLHDEDIERWARVKAAMTSPGSAGLPPIRVYKLGDAYFVLDGNHRVSIARQMGFEQIEAYVTELRSRVPLSPEDSPEDIILKAEYTLFLEETEFDKIVPDAALSLTFPGQYETLKEHIMVHRYYMGLEHQREIPWHEAVRHWYEEVYMPVVRIIRDQNVLEEFPERTETDLYIWIMDHQTYMEEEFGWSIRPEVAASDLVEEQGKRLIRIARRVGEKVLDSLLPRELEDFSSPGEWRQRKSSQADHLISDILVAMSGAPTGWLALEQAVVLARIEGAEVRGLIVKDEDDFDEAADQKQAAAFEERLQSAQLEGNLTFTQGMIAEKICERAKVNDLVVLRLSHPPSSNIFERLSSGFRLILRQCSRPILVVKENVTALDKILLAYDGSPKGKEALFVAAYLTSRYGFPLTVLVVDRDDEKGQAMLDEAADYLGDCCAETIFRRQAGDVSETILNVTRDAEAQLIVMGGYGFSPILEVIFGSTVDGVIRNAETPVLICQ